MDNVETSLHTGLFAKWAQYILFWGVSFLILSRYFSYQDDIALIDIIYTSLFHISLIISVCVNSYLLIPGFLANRRYMAYAILLAATLVVGTWINIYTFRYLADWIFPNYYFISYYSWTNIIQFTIVYIGITTLLQLSRSWFREAEIKQELAEVRQEQAETELKALRAQINPHFLFNSLNHVYSLAVQQSSETGPAILKLSDILRYSISNMNEKKVKLTDELNYLRQYVELYKSRVKYPERIQLSIDEQNSCIKIPPLLLIIFVENCFKHGSIKKPDDKIEIKIAIQDSILSLSTLNTVDLQRELPTESNGLGLENVKRRLKLLYPNKHNLITNEKDEIYTVKLTIEL